jgi:spermidine synthase
MRFLPLKPIFETESNISGKISVFQDGVERKLVVNGATQSIYRSDGSERGYWMGMVPESQVKSVLLLGVGGGTIAKLLRRRWPEVRIVGYELDPVLVSVATSFFDFDEKMELHLEDARKSFENTEKFDYIAVDLYKDHKYVTFAEEPLFLQKIKFKLSTAGVSSFNRIPDSSHGRELEYFESRLRAVFGEVWSQLAEQNFIYWARH